MKYLNSSRNGVLNIYKEKGYTSFDVVALVRKYTGAKAGHTGTLDPDAEGALPVCLGKATKLCDHLVGKSKEYIAGITLGVVTDTQDASGKVLERRAVTCVESDIRAVLSSFPPGYDQIPPMYSAIKVKGQRLYDLARNGQEIERKARWVEITSIELLEYGADRFRIKVGCSKGTYIRALAADIGGKLGCGAHMDSLVRTRVGEFCIENSLKLNEVSQLAQNGDFSGALISMEDALSEYKRIVVSSNAQKYLENGNVIGEKFIRPVPRLNIGEKTLLFSEDGRLFGIYVFTAEGFKPETMLI